MGKSQPEHPELKGSECKGPEAGTNLEHWRKQKKARMAETHGPRASVGRVMFPGQSLVFGVYSDRNGIIG